MAQGKVCGRLTLMVFLALVCRAYGYSSGAPQSACNTTRTPVHLDSNGEVIPPQSTQSPFVITVNPKTYSPNDVITVTVESAAEGQNFPFQGILIQAVKNGQPVGTWQAPSGYKVMGCSNPSDSLTHTSNSDKQTPASFTFTAPSSSVGTLEIRATIAQTKASFWTNHTSVLDDINHAATTGPCANGPCAHGLCFTSSDSSKYFCVCDYGFKNVNCSERVYVYMGTPCDSNPCQNGGNCGVTGEKFTCTCPSGYTGTTCEQTDSCEEGVTCKNGGTCSASSTKMCECPSGYSGDTCEITGTSFCDPNPCKNGGTCISLSTKFACACGSNFEGLTCSTKTTQGTEDPLSRLPLEIWWIVLLALIGLLLFIIIIAVCVVICRSDPSDDSRRMVGEKKRYP